MLFHMIVSHFSPLRLLESHSLCIMEVPHRATAPCVSLLRFNILYTFATRCRTPRDRVCISFRCVDNGEDVSAVARTAVRPGPEVSCDSTERKFDRYVHNHKFDEGHKR